MNVRRTVIVGEYIDHGPSGFRDEHPTDSRTQPFGSVFQGALLAGRGCSPISTPRHKPKHKALVYDDTGNAVPVLARMAAKRGAGYPALGNVVTGAPTPSAWMSAPINTMASGRSQCSRNGKIRSRYTRKGKAPVDSAEISPLITAGKIRCSAHGVSQPAPCRAGAAAPNSPSRPPRAPRRQRWRAGRRSSRRRSPSATPVPHSPARRGPTTEDLPKPVGPAASWASRLN